jgi:hypothetical protein
MPAVNVQTFTFLPFDAFFRQAPGTCTFFFFIIYEHMGRKPLTEGGTGIGHKTCLHGFGPKMKNTS